MHSRQGQTRILPHTRAKVDRGVYSSCSQNQCTQLSTDCLPRSLFFTVGTSAEEEAAGEEPAAAEEAAAALVTTPLTLPLASRHALLLASFLCLPWPVPLPMIRFLGRLAARFRLGATGESDSTPTATPAAAVLRWCEYY
jgi:hypothetical protein